MRGEPHDLFAMQPRACVRGPKRGRFRCLQHRKRACGTCGKCPITVCSGCTCPSSHKRLNHPTIHTRAQPSRAARNASPDGPMRATRVGRYSPFAVRVVLGGRLQQRPQHSRSDSAIAGPRSERLEADASMPAEAGELEDRQATAAPHTQLANSGSTRTDLRRAFGYDEFFAKNVPVTEPSDMSNWAQPAVRRFANAMDRVTATAARIFVGDGRAARAVQQWKEGGAAGETGLRALAEKAAERLPRGSPEKVTLEAVLATAGYADTMSSNLAGTRRAQYDLIMQGNRPQLSQRTVRRFQVPVLEEALDHMLAHVLPLSWGSKTVKAGESIPALTRTKRAANLWRHYKKCHPKADERISRSAYLRIVRTITAGVVKPVAAVDYVVCDLVIDNEQRLTRLIKRGIDASQHKQLLSELATVFRYLKSAYKVHAGRDEICALHCPMFALHHPEADANLKPSCADCAKALAWFKKLESLVPEAHRGMVRDGAHKARLYMGHVQRVVSAQRRLKELVQDVKGGCGKRAHVVIDFQMKHRPLYWREATLLYYGKRGISFHGSALVVPGPNNSVQLLYFDHVIDGESKQDVGMVLSILDALFAEVKRQCPGVESCTVQSDGAAAYCNHTLPLLLTPLASSHGLRVPSFVHSETQDGKGIIDAHFQRVNNHIRTYVTETKADVTCAPQTLLAMAHNDGLPFTTVQMLRLDRTKLNSIMQRASSVRTIAGRVIGHHPSRSVSGWPWPCIRVHACRPPAVGSYNSYTQRPRTAGATETRWLNADCKSVGGAQAIAIECQQPGRRW